MEEVQFRLPMELIWQLFLLANIFMGSITFAFKHVLPAMVVNGFCYGKNAVVGSKSLQVPRSWMRHYYISAVIFGFLTILQICLVVLAGYQRSEVLNYIIETFSPKHTNYNVSAEAAMIVIFLYWIHVLRRIYESSFLCVYSKGSIQIHTIYAMGMIYYPLTWLTLLLVTPGFQTNGSSFNFSGAWLNLHHTVGIAIFSAGWWITLQAHQILARLRTTKEGTVTNRKYWIPNGGLFDYVSCPHYFGEILVYLGIYIVYGGQYRSWLYLMLGVITNQIIGALMAHSWYKEHFKDYPTARKAIIPLIL